MQSQLSEIQQIIPELMSKSKAQIAKLDNTIKTQQEEAKIKEQNLNDGEQSPFVVDIKLNNFILSSNYSLLYRNICP